ncbi:MAG: Sporulation Domain-Containing Protein [Sphingobacteriales bacterium]|nr:Sporulation Domain-Containing Protein [Sphingobacteriales bacterium]
MTVKVIFLLSQKLKRFLLLICMFSCTFSFLNFVSPNKTFAQEETSPEEISVFVNVPGLGGSELDAVIKKEEVYLSIRDLFDYLKINNKPSSDLDSVSGFFLTQKNTFVIDRINNHIILQDKTYPLDKDDLIPTSNNLYIKSSVLGKVFGLDCDFNFRSLSVNLNTKLDLPIIRAKRQALLRSNINKLRSEITADSIIRRKYSTFNMGAADWSVTSSQQQGSDPFAMLNLRLGSMIGGGEANVSLNYNTQQSFKLKQQNYLWRYANNDRHTVRQVIAGKVQTSSVSSLFAPVVGFQITNSPTTLRKSFGTYSLSDYTEPDWAVELYINHILVDYVKADAAGFFTFQVPMVYGNIALQLRFYGPAGEERTKEQIIDVPYNFLPRNEAEYTLTAGLLEDGEQSRFSRLDFKYGLNRRITVGTGMEYLSSISSAASAMPFVNASVSLAPNMILSADYTYDVRARALLNYRRPSGLLFELNYTRYKAGQQAIYNNFLEERKAMVSRQFKGHVFPVFTKLTINQTVFATAKQTICDLLLSGNFKNISSNLTTYAQFINDDYYRIYSNLSFVFRLPRKYTLRPQLQYGYQTNTINSLRFDIDKQLFGHGFLNITYDNNLNYNTQSFSLGLRFDLSAVRASFTARQANNRASFTQSFRGGSLYDRKTKYFKFNDRNNVGRGGLVVSSYLDLNLNNHRDIDEPKLEGLKLKINGGRVQNSSKDTTIRVLDLEPYASYLLELDKGSFDNIAWQFKNSTFKVTIDPNNLKVIEVPVYVKGEASGMVFQSTNDSIGQGRINIKIYRNGGFLAGTATTEDDGYFTFLGLDPGIYTAMVDRQQLSRLKMWANPSLLSFEVKASIEGDIVSDLQFKLESTKELPVTVGTTISKTTIPERKTTIPEIQLKTVESDVKKVKPDVKTKAQTSLQRDLLKENVEIYYLVMVGKVANEGSIKEAKLFITQTLGKKSTETVRKGVYFSLRIMSFQDRITSELAYRKLIKAGLNGYFLYIEQSKTKALQK